MFTELFPIIATTDMTRALRFYRDALGGTVTHEVPGADGTPAYVGIDIGSSHMGLGVNAEVGGARLRPISVWVYTDDCEAAVERLRALDVQVVEGPREQPLGDRVARVLDPDGNEILVGQRALGLLDSLGASLMSPDPTTYTRPEYERRFLVSPGSPWRDLVEPNSKTFEDIYFRRTYLRLRTLSDSSTGQEFIKLTKKLESASAYVRLTGSIPLSPMEYEFISVLEGDRISKARYYHFHRGHVFAIDEFQGDLAGLVLCEVEAVGIEELMRIEPPEYAQVEITEDPFFTGGTLCRTSRDELARKLAVMDFALGGDGRGS
jgi:CYTH domain-containing protein/predicted enzyme related to lactoylglutathione lyase